LWSWPLRRPRNLIIIVVGVVVVVAGASRGAIALTTSNSGGQQHHMAKPAATAPAAPPSSSAPAPAPASSAPPSSSSTPAPSSSAPAPSSSAPHRPSATEIAGKWAAAFEAHKGKTQKEWLAGLEPYSTPELAKVELATVDPANVPGTTVTGHPTVTKDRPKDEHVRVPTNGRDLALVLVKTGDGWRVIDYQPAGKAG
jgi:cytoskeletal protein RodZ